MTDDEITALEKLAEAATPLQRVEVYERHCGNPGCQCQSMTDTPDDNGDYVRAKDVTALEEAVAAVPQLCAEVRKLKALLSRWMGAAVVGDDLHEEVLLATGRPLRTVDDVESLADERDALRTEIERMRPIVTAARDMVSTGRKDSLYAAVYRYEEDGGEFPK